MMTTKEIITKVVEKMGYRPEVDDDGDIYFWYQMKAIYVLTNGDDNFISIMHPQFYEIEEGQEALVLTVCNKMTRELKTVKVFLDKTFTSVSGTCELYFTDEDMLEKTLERALEVFGVLRTLFRLKMKEMKKE